MAEIKLFLKGKNEPKKIYFRYRPNREIDIEQPTPYSINSENWDTNAQIYSTQKIIKGAKSIEAKTKNKEIEDFNQNLNSFRLEISKLIEQNIHFGKEDLKKILKNHIAKKYFGKEIEVKRKTLIPELFSELADYYSCFRSTRDLTQDRKPISPAREKKIRNLRDKVKRFNPNLKVTEINNIFRGKFTAWLDKENYSEQTQVADLKLIKTLCLFAETDHPISQDVIRWKIKNSIQAQNVKEGLYFSFEKLRTLMQLDLSQNERLDNVRDWLFISCYTGTRNNEFLSMKKENITQNERGDEVIEVIDKGGEVKFPFISQPVREILDKRNGEFPRKISQQKYNEYLKELCKLAGFTEMVESAKDEITAKGRRAIKGSYPFYELVSGHMGRRTFNTLFDRYLSQEARMNMSNHHSKAMSDYYNKTDPRKLQLRRTEIVAQEMNNIDFSNLLKIA